MSSFSKNCLTTFCLVLLNGGTFFVYKMTISWAVRDPSDLKYKWRTPIPQSIMDVRQKNAFIFICLYWVWTIPNQTIHNYTTVSILHNQPAEWSLLEQGLTQRSQTNEGHLLFLLFCVAPFCCAVNCFRKKCGKETWDLKAAITTSSCSFEPMIPQLEALWVRNYTGHLLEAKCLWPCSPQTLKTHTQKK